MNISFNSSIEDTNTIQPYSSKLEFYENKMSSNFNTWFSLYGKTYAAHASNNYDPIIKSGKLCCAEDVLLTTGKVEHESSTMAGRSIACIKDGTPFGGYIALDKISKKTDQIRTIYLVPKYCEEQFREKFKTADKIKDKGSYIKYTYNTGSEEIYSNLDSILESQEIILEKDKTERVEGVIIKGPKLPFVKVESADKDLRAIFKDCMNKGICMDRLSFALYVLRKNLSSGSRIQSEIRVSCNSVWWAYGKIAFLVGLPETKLFSSYSFSGCHFKDSKGKEFPLKEPFQVENGYYQELLDNPENLIIGPKEILSSYLLDPTIPDSIKEKLIYKEMIPEELKALFNISS